MKLIKGLLIVLAAVFAFGEARAVTDGEMEQAKAIAAKQYLRWANNGSGYLDEFEVKSMAELTAKLKAKEKENLTAFNAVKVPTDYASWDKDKLVEYWSVTFFASPGLDENGKGAKSSIKKKIQAMTVSAPSKAEEPAAPEVTQPEETAPMEMPTAQDAVEQEQDILNDQKAIADDARLAQESRQEEQSHTWVYVMVLAILVGVVIWLVVYAANVMKRQPTGKEGSGSESESELRAQAKAAITKKNDELNELRQRLQKEENRAADLSMEVERLKLDNSRLHQQIVKMREEGSAVSAVKAETTIRERESERKESAQPKTSKVIYLGRANQRGIFVRADRRIAPGNTIFRLDTKDGLVGTFHVVDEPEIIETALDDPALYLSAACTGEDIDDTAGVTRIATDSEGTAIFENGYWKVLRKTKIRYE